MSTNSLQIRLSFVFHKVGWITDSKYFNQPSFSHFFNGCGLCLEYFSMHWDVVTNTCMLLVGIEWVFVSFDTFSILNAEVISSTKSEWCRHCFPKKLPNFWLQFYALSCSSAWTQLIAKILALTGFLLGSNKSSVIVRPYLVSWTPVYEELP